MGLEIVNVCSGIGCDVSLHCDHYRYVENAPGRYVRTWMPTQPGEGCPDYRARFEPKERRSGWGDGAEPND